MDISIDLVAQGIKPNLVITVHNGSFGVNFLSPMGILKLRKELLEKYDLSKIGMTLNFSMKKIYEKDFELGRIRFKATNKKNLFNIKNLNMDVFGGRLQSSGSVLLEPYVLNFVYALNSARIPKIAALMPKGFVNSGGGLSASGMWSTNGEKIKEQLYNFYTKSNIIANGITVSNISIDNFIKILSAPNYNIVEFPDDLKKALLTGKTYISDFKTSLDVSKGIFKMPDLIFKTKYSSGIGSAIFDLYKFNLDLNNIFSFYLTNPKHSKKRTSNSPATMKLKSTGSLMLLKKEADTKDLLEVLKTRVHK